MSGRFNYTIGPNGMAWIHVKDVPNPVKSRATASAGSQIGMSISVGFNPEWLDFLREIKAVTGTARHYIIDEERINDPEAKGIVI